MKRGFSMDQDAPVVTSVTEVAARFFAELSAATPAWQTRLKETLGVQTHSRGIEGWMRESQLARLQPALHQPRVRQRLAEVLDVAVRLVVPGDLPQLLHEIGQFVLQHPAVRRQVNLLAGLQVRQKPISCVGPVMPQYAAGLSVVKSRS